MVCNLQTGERSRKLSRLRIPQDYAIWVFFRGPLSETNRRLFGSSGVKHGLNEKFNRPALFLVLGSKRITGLATKTYSWKRKLQQRPPLRADEVGTLERVVLQSISRPLGGQVAAGFMLYMFLRGHGFQTLRVLHPFSRMWYRLTAGRKVM